LKWDENGEKLCRKETNGLKKKKKQKIPEKERKLHFEHDNIKNMIITRKLLSSRGHQEKSISG